MIAVLLILAVWIGLLALLLGVLRAGTGMPTPRPAREPFLTSNTIELDLDIRRAA